MEGEIYTFFTQIAKSICECRFQILTLRWFWNLKFTIKKDIVLQKKQISQLIVKQSFLL